MAKASAVGKEKDSRILIKKYSNRRLYDVTHSQYLTLEELVNLIKEGYEVQVVDSKTKQDITQSVLTQVFLEHSGTYLFSTSFLHQIIRNRDGLLGEFFTDFVPKFLDAYLEMRDSMKRQISSLTSPRNWLSTTKKDLKTIMQPFITEDSKAKLEGDELPAPLLEDTSKTSDVMGLQEKIRELEKRINEIDH